MLSTLASRTGSLKAVCSAQSAQLLLTRFLSTTQVRHAGPESLYLYVKPEEKKVVKTEEEKAMEAARKIRTWETAQDIFYGPDRDLKNFPHPVMIDATDKHHLGVIPHSWFKALYPRLGVTGPYTLTWGFLIYMMSKEKIVFEHQFPEALAWILMLMWVNKKFGPSISKYLDKEAKAAHERKYDAPLETAKEGYTATIKEAEEEVWRQEAVPLIFQAKKENIALQLETFYRQRLAQVHTEVKKRLDYQAEIEATQRQFEQKHMVNWIVNNVVKGITPQQEKESIANCIQTLKTMSATASI